MKRLLALATVLAAFCAPSYVGAQMSPTGPGSIPDIVPGGDDATSAQVALPQEPEAKAEAYRLDGKCDRAIPIFQALANKGPGYEIAEYNLGLCLFDTAKASTDAQRVQDLRREALDWILKAANGNLATAQIDLVRRYLDGDGAPVDPVEAGKWSLVYRSNGQRLALGLPSISADLQAQLDGKLSEKNWSDAQAQADAWSPATQSWSDGN